MTVFSDRAFAGKRLLLTGGSSGIGEEIAVQAASLGMRVAFCGRNAEAGGRVEARCQGRGRFIRCDLTFPEEIARFVREAADFLGGAADYLVNAAATDSRLDFDGVDEKAFESFVNSDLRPAVLVTRAALELLRRGEGKSIVNFGTTNWMIGLAPFTLYGAAKSGLLGFTRALARELGCEMIRVNMISPGCILLVKAGEADGLVSGARSTTGDMLRPALQIIKTVPGVSCVSGAFTMFLPEGCPYGTDGRMVFADCAVTPMPTAEQLAEIAICTADTAKAIAKIDPVTAILSFSTKGSAKHEVVDKVIEATRIAKERRPDLVLDGELQADAANQ